MLAREEWSNYCRYRYGFEPTNLHEYCDGCGEQCTMEHSLHCKKGGLVHGRHDNVADEWAYLAALTWQPGAVSHKPMVNEDNHNGGGNEETVGPALAPVFRQNNATACVGAAANNQNNN